MEDSSALDGGKTRSYLAKWALKYSTCVFWEVMSHFLRYLKSVRGLTALYFVSVEFELIYTVSAVRELHFSMPWRHDFII